MPGGRGPQTPELDFPAELARHRPALERSALRLCRNRQDAEDLVQSTFVRAWQARAQLTPGGNVAGWLFRILTNHHRDNLRRRTGIQVPLPDDVPDRAQVDEAIGSFLAIEPEVALDAMGRLPAELRAPLELLVVRGKRYREIAAELSVPISTVGTRIRRARQLLQEIFAAATAAHRGGSR